MTRIGLIGAGAAARSAVARFLPGSLGPVKSGSYRLAGRLAGSLRTGFPVKNYEDLGGAGTILICVPERTVPEIIDEIAASALDLSDKTVVLCDSMRDSAELEPLKNFGAAVASLNEVHEYFVAEGDRTAVRFIRRFLRQQGVRAIELNPGSKSLFFAGLSFSDQLLAPLACAALTSYRLAGLDRAQAAKIMEKLFERALRAFITAGKKGWSAPNPVELPDPVLNEYRRLQTESALLLLGATDS